MIRIARRSSVYGPLGARAILALGLLLLGAEHARAQRTTGSVNGVVLDPQGAVVPGARLELVSTETGTTLTQASGAEGFYVFNFVPPGTYVLTAQATGFRPAAVADILVEVSKVTTIDVKLETGAIEESVEVVASRARIDTTSAQVSTNIDRQEIEALPSFNRSVLEFVELAPGVDFDVGPTEGGQVLNIQGVGAGVNGNRVGRNGFYLDGVDNTGAFRNQGLNFPNPDTVQEMQVATSNTAAEFGRQPGGNFNVVTKSGTNQFRGTGAYFFRDKSLNANTWANNRNDVPRLDDDRKNTSATLGGPLRRNRTFFFTSFMAFRDNDPGQQNSTRFPTEAMARGDFSGVPLQLLDPDTGQALVGNHIPDRLLDPVALGLVELMPRVEDFGDRFFWSFEGPLRNNELLIKIDHHLGAAHTLQGTYFTTWGKGTLPTTGATSNIPAWGPQLNTTRQHTAAVRHTWILGSRTVLESRVSAARLDADRTNANNDRNIADFGAQNYPISQEGARKFLPRLTIQNGPTGHNGFLGRFNQANYQAVTSLSWIVGRHNVKLGLEVQRQNVDSRDDSDQTRFVFDGRLSAGLSEAPQGAEQFAFAFADFLMGRMTPASSWEVAGIADGNVVNWNVFGYVQDEWKIGPRLTVTPGLRYEVYARPSERDDQEVAFVRGHQSSRFPTAPTNLGFAGDAGLEAGFFRPDRNNIAPRLGLAWDVQGDGRTAVRAGAGWYYSYNPMQISLFMGGNPFRPRAFGSGGRLSDPWLTSQNPTYTTPPTPFTNEDIDNFPWTPPYIASAFAEDFVTPYSMQWNISLERQMLDGVSVTAAYVGNRGHKFTQIIPINFAPYEEGADDTTANVNRRRPVPDFLNVGEVGSTARLWYDALQVSARLRRRDVSARVSYVLAKGSDTASVDPTDTRAQVANPLDIAGERGQNQRRHTFRAFFAWEVPFLRDRNTLASSLLGGWQVSGTVRARTGAPLNVTLGRDWNFDSVPGDRPDLVGPVQYPKTELGEGAFQWFDPAAFALPGGGTDHNVFGTTPRNAIFGPGDWNVDTALLKQFRVGGDRRVELRFEAYNVFNHPNLSNPSLDFANANFGQILGRTGNRRVQLGVKVYF